MVREFLRHGSNGLIAGGLATFAALHLTGGPKLKPVPVGIGLLLFFSSEYTTHRFLLHAEPSKHETLHALQRRLHYDHHVEPSRLDLLFLPPWALVPTVIAYTGAYALATRDADATASLLFGNFLALMYYEWVHYVAHIPFKPKTRYGRYIKKYHLWHHFKNEKLWFGVTNPSGDHLSGTFLEVDEAERSPTTRLLFPEPSRN